MLAPGKSRETPPASSLRLVDCPRSHQAVVGVGREVMVRARTRTAEEEEVALERRIFCLLVFVGVLGCLCVGVCVLCKRV